jgi:hypothetical protein
MHWSVYVLVPAAVMAAWLHGYNRGQRHGWEGRRTLRRIRQRYAVAERWLQERRAKAGMPW